MKNSFYFPVTSVIKVKLVSFNWSKFDGLYGE